MQPQPTFVHDLYCAWVCGTFVRACVLFIPHQTGPYIHTKAQPKAFTKELFVVYTTRAWSIHMYQGGKQKEEREERTLLYKK